MQVALTSSNFPSHRSVCTWTRAPPGIGNRPVGQIRLCPHCAAHGVARVDSLNNMDDGDVRLITKRTIICRVLTCIAGRQDARQFPRLVLALHYMRRVRWFIVLQMLCPVFHTFIMEGNNSFSIGVTCLIDTQLCG